MTKAMFPLMLFLQLTGVGAQGTTAACRNPTCSSPPCAAAKFGDVGCTTVSGTAGSLSHGFVSAGSTIASNSHIFGPFEAGFTSKQDSIITAWGCSTPSAAYDVDGGKDLDIAEKFVANACSITFPRTEGSKYIGIVGPCGGHTNDYHFHRGFSCLYSASGGHSAKVGDIADKSLYGKWEDYANNKLPYLDACGGHFGPTPDSSANVYHYHVQDRAPHTVGCHGPSSSGGLVNIATCRALYNECGDGDTKTIQTADGPVSYDLYCPCFDADGSNTGTKELPALGTSEISYDASTSSSPSPSAIPTPTPVPSPTGSASSPSPTPSPSLTSSPTPTPSPSPTSSPTAPTADKAVSSFQGMFALVFLLRLV